MAAGRLGVVAAMVVTWMVASPGVGLAAGGTNLLKNGTFEGTGTGSLTGWSGSNAGLSLAADGVGGGYAELVAASAAGTYSTSTSSKPVQNAPAGEQFSATGMIRSDAPGKTVCLILTEYDSTGTTSIGAQQTCVVTTSTWAAFPTLTVSVANTGDALKYTIKQKSGVVGDSFELDNMSIVDLDTSTPTVPTGLTATAPGPNEVDLSWQPSTDPDYAGVSGGYSIYRNGNSKPIATVDPSTTSYSDTTVLAGTKYTYTIAAFDYAKNYSAQSLPVSITTPAPALNPTNDTWHMDEADGTTMVDSTGNHPGTLHAIALGQPGDPAFPGTAYGFDGVSSYVSIPTADDLNAYTADVHIAFSLKTSTVPPTPDYDLFRKGEYPGQEYKVELQPNGQVSCEFRGSLKNSVIQAGPDLHDGVWHRIQCIKQATSITLTIDGMVWTKAVSVGSIASNYDMIIGAYPFGDQYQGLLDEVSFRTG